VVFGPVDIITLCTWATDARVIPGCELSKNREAWFPVETIPEFRLNWSVELSDGTLYGPLNLLAIQVLAVEKSIPRGVRLNEKGSSRTAILDESVIPLLAAELQQMLSGCSALMNAMLGAQHADYQKRQAEFDVCDGQLMALRADQQKLQAEFDVCDGQLMALRADQQKLRTELEIREAQLGNLQELLQKSAEELLSCKNTSAVHLETARAELSRKGSLVRELEADLTRVKTQVAAHGVAMRVAAEQSSTELGAAIQQKELLREDYEGLKTKYDHLLQESSRKEKESSEKLKRIEQEIKDSTELVAKTRLELESRVSHLCEREKKSDGKECEARGENVYVDVEVVHAEVIEESGGEDVAGMDTESMAETLPDPSGTSPGTPGVLDSVEARLQMELRQWELLNREQENQKRTGGKWFRRK
jgi:hypothetical protein